MSLMNSFLPCPNRLCLFAAIAITAVLLSSCRKDPEPLFDNGMITGNIDIYNPGGPLKGNNVTIIAHGPYGSKSTSSDYEGHYELPGLGNGTYEIEFNKEGYGIYRRPGIQIFGNDTLIISERLYRKADYKMPKLSKIMYYPDFENMDARSVAIVTDIPSGNTEEMQIRIFLNDTKEVSYKNYKYTDTPYAYSRENATQLMIVNADPYYPNWGGPIFPRGQTRYMIAYVCSREDNAYFDEYYGLRIYSTVDERQHSGIFEIKYP
jgi:hypothetical protein